MLLWSLCSMLTTANGSLSPSLPPSLSPAAEQYDGVLVCGCAVSRRVEAAVHQTPTPVQVSQVWVYRNRLILCWIMWIMSRIVVIVAV